MPTTVDDLLVRVVVDSSGAVKGFEAVGGGLKKASDGAERAEGKMGLLEKTLGALGVKAIVVNQAVELATKAYEALVEPIRACNEAYQAQLKAETLLSNALKLKGQFTQANIDAFKEFNEELERTTTVSAKTAFGIEGIAKASGFSDQKTKAYLKTAADLADFFEGDASAAFEHLTMLQKGSDRELEKMFPQLRAMSPAAKEAGKGFEFLAGKVDGFAKIAAKTRVGAAKQLSNAVEGVMVEIGRTIDEVFGRTPEQTQKLIQVLQKVKDTVGELRDRLLLFKKTLSEVDWDDVAASATRIGAALLGMFAAIKIDLIIQMTAQMLKFAASAAEMLLIAAAFIAIAGAVDIVYRNINRLPDLLDVVIGAFKVMALRGMKAISELALSLDQGLFSALSHISGSFLDVGGVATKAMEGISADTQKTYGHIDELNKSIDAVGQGIKKSGKDIDTGFLGQGIKLFNNLLKDTQKEIKKTKDEAKPGKGDANVMSYDRLKQIADMIAQIGQENAALGAQIMNESSGQLEAMDRQLGLDLLGIAMQEKKLKAEGLMTDELQRQLDMKKDLLKQSTDAKKNTVEHPQLIDKNSQEMIKKTFGDAAGDFTKTISSALGDVSAAAVPVMGAIDGVLDFVQKLIDFVPQVLEKIANIFNTLTDLPNKILAGIQDVMKSIINFVSNFIPNLLNAIPKILDTLIGGLFEQLPKAFTQLMARLPDLINGLIEKLPDLISRLIDGLISMAPKIIAALITYMIKGMPKIALELIKYLAIGLPKAIVKGLIDGVKDAISALMGIFKPKIDMSGVKKTVDDIGKAVTKVSSDVFQVMDMAASDKAKGIGQQIQDATKAAGNFLGNLWKNFMNGLKAVWQWVYDHIIGPIVNALRAVWQFVYDSILKPIIDGIRAVWDFVYDSVIKPFLKLLGDSWNALTSVFKGIWDNFIKPIASVITDSWKAIIDFFKNIFSGKIGEAFKGILDFFTKSFKTLVEAPFNTFKSIVESFQNIPFISDFKNAVSHLFDIPPWLKPLQDAMNSLSGGGGGGGGVVGHAVGVVKSVFGGAVGGPIPAYAGGGTIAGSYSPSRIDSQLIRAQAGEYMMRREAVVQYGSDFMHQVNKGQYKPDDHAQGGGNVTIQKLEVNVTPQKLDDRYVTNDLAPKIMQQIQKESLRGKYIMDQKGVRK